MQLSSDKYQVQQHEENKEKAGRGQTRNAQHELDIGQQANIQREGEQGTGKTRVGTDSHRGGGEHRRKFKVSQEEKSEKDGM